MNHEAAFLTKVQAEQIRAQLGTPVFVYSEALLREQAKKILNLPTPFGFTVRYAMKALPTRAILQLFSSLGIEMDASSGYEAERAILAGIPGEKIMLTAQELPKNLVDLVKAGVFYNACSLHQLETYGRFFPGTSVGVRINPGRGSGANAKVNVAGDQASFGIWHEQLEEVQALLEKYQLHVRTVHTHIGSGTDPQQWQEVAELSASFLEAFPSATRLSLGGGFKVARMPYEKSADLQEIGQRIAHILHEFAQRTGRRIHLELEPGTFLVAKAGAIVSTVQDIVSTSAFRFIKLDTGMSEIIRPAMYGAQHPITILNDAKEEEEVVVAGHSCESADLLTVKPDDPESPQPRRLPKASIGDLAIIDGAGAYCSGMSTKNYNSFPEAAELLLTLDGGLRLIRSRQSLEEMVAREL